MNKLLIMKIEIERLLYVDERPILCVNCKSTGLQSDVARATLEDPKQGKPLKNVDHAYCSSCKTLMVYGY